MQQTLPELLESIEHSLVKLQLSYPDECQNNINLENKNILPTPNSDNITNNYHTHYHERNNSFSYWPLFSQPYTQTSVVNNNYNYPSHSSRTLNYVKNKENKEEKKKQLSKGEIVVAFGTIAAIACTAIYVLSKDEYINYKFSELDEKIKILHMQQYMFPQNSELITKIMLDFKKWKKLFLKRTVHNTYAKIGATSSMIASIGGICMTGTLVLCTGMTGVTISSCYLLWNYLKKDTYEEEKYYKNIIEQIKTLITLYNTHSHLSASAPPPAYNS